MYFNDFKNRNFSVLSLKLTETMEQNKIRHFSMGHIQIYIYIYKTISINFKIKIPQFYE